MDDLALIYQQFRPKITRYLNGLLGEQETEDVLQTVMLNIAHGLPAFRGASSLSTWIYRIATNAAHDHLRQQRMLPMTLDEDDTPHWTGPDLSQTHIRNEMGACIRSLIQQLPHHYRTVLLLSEYEGCSNTAIAAILGLSLATVKIRLHRARGRLRQLMECECHLYHHDDIGLMCDRRKK